MTLSPELTRFLADHATAESWAAFANGVGTAPTAANLAAAMSAKGYQVGEADVVAALEFSKQSPLADQQLDAVVGGTGTNDDLVNTISTATAAVKDKLGEMSSSGGSISIVDMFQMQMLMNKLSQLSEMSTSVVSASNSAIASMARNVKS